MFIGVLIETWGVSLVWVEVKKLDVRGNYLCCLVIVVVFMGLGEAKTLGGLKSSHEGKGGKLQKGVAQFLWEEFTA